jgi:hypothetical protein
MCGNVTLLGQLAGTERGALPKGSVELLRRMLRVSQMRGAQSGGGAIQVSRGAEPRQLIQKFVNSKRGDLGTELSRALQRRVGRRAAFGGSVLVQTHVRFATAGVTEVHEAHPFRFVDAEQRGPRRVFRLTSGQPKLEVRTIETALSHNGDMDGLRFRGVSVGYPELGALLERVLGVRNRWSGDSPLLAGAIELYVTQGMWFESMRLAYHLTIAPPPPDPRTVAGAGSGRARTDAYRGLLSSHPAPSADELRRWEGFAEAVFLEREWTALTTDTGGSTRRQRERLTARLADRFSEAREASLPGERLVAFTRAAVNAFFDNDLYIALRKLEPGLLGTFGCVATSTLEPGSLVAFSRGQPLSIGFRRQTPTVAVVSERSALKVQGPDGSIAFDERLDLDLCRGEVVRAALKNDGQISLLLYAVADGRELSSDELVATGRLVPLRDNPYVTPLPPEPKDRVAADLAALPELLLAIRRSFRDPEAHNAKAARAFGDALLTLERPKLLVIGITNELWLAQQFVKNLSALFPSVQAEALSSNRILIGEKPEVDCETVVLAVSQSGQDFPTLGALVQLLQQCGQDERRFFVLSSEIDSLMAQAIGQSSARGAAFCERIFANLSGFRPCEAALASVHATQHTLNELLLSLAEHAADKRELRMPLHGCALERHELRELSSRRDLSIDRNLPEITGKLGLGPGVGLERAIERKARRWSWHVLEPLFAFLGVVLVLELNLVFGAGLLPSRPFWGASGVWRGIAGQLDVAFYALLGPALIWSMRVLQGRALLHRQGLRELLIGDTRYVHQISWLFARKLFSLSYGFASIKPYSADCQDELVMTHEPLRGTLALIGVPDGRRDGLGRRASAALMSAKQFAFSRSLGGSGAEIITISHAPGSGLGAHLQLPGTEPTRSSARVAALVEDMFDSWERLLAFQIFLDRLARRVSRFGLLRYDRSRTKDQVFAPTTASPVSAAAVFQSLSRSAERYEQSPDPSLPFDVGRSEYRGSAPPAKTTVWRDFG